MTNNKRQKCILNRELYEVVRNKCSMQSVTTVSTRHLLFVFIQDKFSGSKWNSVYIKVIGSAILNFSLALSKKWIKACRNNNKFNKMYTEWPNSQFKIPNHSNN